MVRKKTSGNQVSVGNITDLHGEVNVAGRDIIKNINTIYQRALTAAEKATRTRKQEIKLLAKGVARLVRIYRLGQVPAQKVTTPIKGYYLMA